MLQGQQITGSTRSCLVAESSRGRGIRVCIGLWEPGLLGPPRAAMQRKEKSWLALLRSTKSQSDRKEREGDMVSGGHSHLWEGDIAGECRKTRWKSPQQDTTPRDNIYFQRNETGIQMVLKILSSQARRTKHRFHCVTKHKVTLSVLWNSGSFLRHWELLGWLWSMVRISKSVYSSCYDSIYRACIIQ